MAVGAAVDSLAELPREGERLDIEANLGVEIDGRTFAVSSEGDRVVVHAPSVSACLAVADNWGRLPDLAALLADAGVTVEVRTGNAVLAIVGAEADSGGLTASLVAAAVELRANEIVAGLLRLR